MISGQKLDKARSLRYRSQFLQENMRWKALAEIYTMHSFAPFSKRNVLFEIRFKKCQNCHNLARIRRFVC